MSRPANPTWSTVTFATDVNFPAGAMPWSGLPTKVVPAGMATGITPKSAFAAQGANYLWNYCTDRISLLKATDDALINYVGQLPVNNWGVKIGGMTGGGAGCAWDEFNSRLWLIGRVGTTITAWLTENLTSTDSVNRLATPSTEIPQDGACDASGNLVVSTTTRFVYEVNAASLAGTKPDVGLAAGAVGYSVQFEPVTNRFVWIGYDGTNTVAKYSTNRTAWTVGGTIVAGAANFKATAVATRKSTGVILALRTSGTTAQVYKSTNGGTAWTGPVTFTISTATVNPTLEFDEDSATWYASMSDGSVKSDVWRSTDDGATWTRITLLTASNLYGVAAVGSMLVGVSGVSSNRVAYSLDAGATWRTATMKADSSAAYVFRAPNFLALPTSDGFYISARFGKSQASPLT